MEFNRNHLWFARSELRDSFRDLLSGIVDDNLIDVATIRAIKVTRYVPLPPQNRGIKVHPGMENNSLSISLEL